MSLETIIDSLNVKLRTVDNVRFVPDEPVDQIPQSVHGIVYPTALNWNSAPNPSYRIWYDITIQVGMVRLALHKTVPLLLEFSQSVPTAIEEWICEEQINIDTKEATFGPYEWGGVEMIGWIFQLANVKEMVTP